MLLKAWMDTLTGHYYITNSQHQMYSTKKLVQSFSFTKKKKKEEKTLIKCVSYLTFLLKKQKPF